MDSTLHNCEQSLMIIGFYTDTSIKPADRAFKAALNIVPLCGKWWTFVKGHDDISPECFLHLDTPFWCQVDKASIEVTLERYAFFSNFAHVPKAHHLEAPGISKERPWISRKSWKPAMGLDQCLSGPEHQVVGVAQNHLRPYIE